MNIGTKPKPVRHALYHLLDSYSSGNSATSQPEGVPDYEDEQELGEHPTLPTTNLPQAEMHAWGE